MLKNFKNEKWLYLLATIIFVWNLIYFILVNSFKEPKVVSWENIFKDKNSIQGLLLPLGALIISVLGFFIAFFWSYKNHKTKKNKFKILWLITISFSMIIALIVSVYSQIYLETHLRIINTSEVLWSNYFIWINATALVLTIIGALIQFTLKINPLTDNENAIGNLENLILNDNAVDSQMNKSPQTEYLPNTNMNVNYNDNYATSVLSNLTETLSINDVNDYLEANNNNEVLKPLVSENKDFEGLIPKLRRQAQAASNLTSNTSILGFTQQIKNEYNKDFGLVQELHRINMAQSNPRIAKLINVFYNRYDRALDLDVDRVMLLIYRVALDFEGLHSYLKDAILHKLDTKFISDLARNWFIAYSNKVNTSYSTNRILFKKTILEGITIMDNDIEKYLQQMNHN